MSAVNSATGLGFTMTSRATEPGQPKLFSASSVKVKVTGASVSFSNTCTGLGTMELGVPSPKDQMWFWAPLTTGAIIEKGEHASVWSKTMLNNASGFTVTGAPVVS